MLGRQQRGGAERCRRASLLDEIAREGARRMLLAALETEVAAYLEAYRDERDADGSSKRQAARVS